MPVLAKFCGIVIRMMVGTTIGTRVHAFHEGSELVIALHPLRVLHSEVPSWVEAQVLHWIQEHRGELFSPWCVAHPVLQDGWHATSSAASPPAG
jgi:hypothetical protein